MRCKMVSDVMRRDRFLKIWKFFHLADNTKVDATDKYYKLRPLIEKLQSKFAQFYVPEKNLNFDESMVKYFGRHSCKQFIKGKPIRFGYKVWCLNGKSGYLINFNICQRKDPKFNENYSSVFGACAAPFITMMDELPNDKKHLPYSLFCDNLFTSFHLLNHFKERGYDVTGTIRDNRIPKNCPIVSTAMMKRKQRAEATSILDRTNGIILVCWVDNNVVTIVSTSSGVNPQSMVKRYSRASKKVIKVLQPHLITNYNNFMGGTDLMNENINRFRIGLRSKKWNWVLYTWLLDATIQNAWILSKKSGNNLTQLQFRREIVKVYLTKYKTTPKQGSRSESSASSRSFCRVSDNVRFDGQGHLLVPVAQNKKIRCAGENCSSIMRTKCVKCDVGLCKNYPSKLLMNGLSE
ncbi:piggyBac transposable element-derived protein 3-like [Euwallacea similis]|uniref:piggyBac transposable element-derived protein 3-like n=1 Tax=Euwallacea similis TaxID=1736056 RepID=UPI00344E5DD2